MTEHRCNRCGYTTSRRCNFIRHLRRKFPCPPTNQEISVLDVYNMNFKQNDVEELTHNNILATNNNSILTACDSILTACDSTSEKYVCIYCKNGFKHPQSKYRHQKTCSRRKSCEQKQEIELLKEQQQQMKKKMEEMEKRIAAAPTIIGTQNNTQNITQNITNEFIMCPYDEPDFSHLTNSDYVKALNQAPACIQYMLQKIHFDPDKPENHNVHVTNMKNSYILVYDGEKWQALDKHDVIDDICKNGEFILKDKLEDWKNQGRQNHTRAKQKFDVYKESKMDTREEKKRKRAIMFMLYSSQDVVKQTRRAQTPTLCPLEGRRFALTAES